MNLHLLSLAFSALLFIGTVSCHNNPTPVNPPDGGTGGQPPIATGGQSSTGGAAATGGSMATGGTTAAPKTTGPSGYDLCYAATKSDPGRQRQARENNMSIDVMAAQTCSFSSVQDCFAKGVCK